MAVKEEIQYCQNCGADRPKREPLGMYAPPPPCEKCERCWFADVPKKHEPDHVFWNLTDDDVDFLRVQKISPVNPDRWGQEDGA